MDKLTILSQDLDQALEQIKSMQSDMEALVVHRAKADPSALSQQLEAIKKFLDNAVESEEDDLRVDKDYWIGEANRLELQLEELNPHSEDVTKVVSDSWNDQ